MQNTKFHMSRRTALGGIASALILPRAALANGLTALSGRAFGTTWRLTAPQGSPLAQLTPAIDSLFAQIDQTFSPWRPDSTIAHFNGAPADAPVQSAELAHVTQAALTIAHHSDGAFDPTVGPLVAKWGFGPIHTGGAHDWRGIDTAQDTISKTRGDLTLDLCGIAKGHALDRAAALVSAAGLDTFLFELGGEFIVHGQHPDGRDWQLAIDTPLASGPTLHVPAGSAIATSGVWEQSYALNNRRYSHIIDTGTATPVAGALRSVTLVAPDAMTADGWATGLCAAGAEDGLALARNANLAALFLIEDDTGLHQIATDPIQGLLL